MAAAKKSAIEALHRMYVATLTLELQAGQGSAAILQTIGNFLHKSGVRATDDSPKMQALAKSWQDLPFRDDDTPKLPKPHPKDTE